MTGDARQALVACARSANTAGLNIGTAGNLSLRCEGGMLITPSAVPYDRLEADQIVRVRADGSVARGSQPSSEWRMHLAIYEHFPSAGAVVHTHSPHATSLACLGMDMPAFHYEVALAGGDDIRCARYATFGTSDLSANVVAALEGRRACLVANHGVVCQGSDLDAAMALAHKVEQLATVYCQCLTIGRPVILSAEEMEAVAARFKNYGSHSR